MKQVKHGNFYHGKHLGFMCLPVLFVPKFQEKELQICVDTTRLNLVSQGVWVAWKWEWQNNDSDGEYMSESSAEYVGHSHQNPHIQSDTESSESVLHRWK